MRYRIIFEQLFDPEATTEEVLKWAEFKLGLEGCFKDSDVPHVGGCKLAAISVDVVKVLTDWIVVREERFKEDCERLIYLDGCGRIVEESILRKFYPDRQDWDKLLSVIEDNIISETGHQEQITWHQVWKEFAC